ncbi:MAG: hypothetical protein ACXVCX_22535, partial [Ktedonobacterales bacterium]
MADLARKLAIQPGQTLCLIDLPAAVAATLRQEAPPGITFATESEAVPLACDLIFFAPLALDGLAERFASLQRRIAPS